MCENHSQTANINQVSLTVTNRIVVGWSSSYGRMMEHISVAFGCWCKGRDDIRDGFIELSTISSDLQTAEQTIQSGHCQNYKNNNSHHI